MVKQPLWKMMELKSVGMMTFPIYGKNKNVPNHQAVIAYSCYCCQYAKIYIIYLMFITIGEGIPIFQCGRPKNVGLPQAAQVHRPQFTPMTHSQQPARRRLWTSSPPGLPLRPAMELWIHKGKWKHCDKTEDKSTKKCEFIMLESTNRILRYWIWWKWL